MNICVTNLSRETSEESLRYTFGAFGQVRGVSIVRDDTTGGVKAVVSMPVEQEARMAISKMNGQEYQGRIVQAVGQARTNILPLREKPPAPRRGRGGARRPSGAKRPSHGRPSRGRRRK